MMIEGNKSWVALIDDDASLCKALSRLLRAAGISSISYLSAEAFLADTTRASPECLVLDIQLQGMSGFELQRALQTQKIKIPIIFITAHDELETRLEVERSGCLAYLRKTDPGQDVLEAVRRALSSQGVDQACANRTLDGTVS